MLELRNDRLCFGFEEVSPGARLQVGFQRTLRIPDDGKTYPLPPGLGFFPLRHVDDYAERLPDNCKTRGGVMLPIYQAEALWVHFSGEYDGNRHTEYPFAVKIAAGKINAVTGKGWSPELHRSPQDYLVYPTQPWLDGFCVAKGLIRQFVAMPLGQGYTAEEQITGEAEFGGLQIMVYPMRAEVFKRRFPVRSREYCSEGVCLSAPCIETRRLSMGLAPGGRMKQEIYHDKFDLDDWDQDHALRCFVHLANSEMWRAITGVRAPTKPPTAHEYAAHGLPWFDYYDEHAAPVPGSKTLKKLKSVAELGKVKHETPLPENTSCTPGGIKVVTPKDQVDEGTW